MFRDDAFQDDPADAFEYVLDRPDRCWNYEPSRAEVFKEFAAAVYTTDAEGWLTYYNDAAAELWGFRPVLGKARWCGSWRLYEPDGTLVPHGESPLAVALQTGVITRGQQMLLERPDGTRVPIIPSPTALRDRTGTLVAGSNVLLRVSSARPRRRLGREAARSRLAMTA
ncbi:hypothetical protein [Methylobacterium symbioticum]|uniref:PAS domain-containing protein n=1 Tax=Methylobacterium symbioticum TaxID=2584084 RepID=A0A509EH34_9HYPH|nr:hypothetical protein [Methylobacterium symbioticum]VUD72493.1 hypothetical protein MET9862_03093 [Methylobacterium symbioticum]